eukprot:TRINITY_DN10149_c0_g2_i1.p1 TRINITY_DN10149_c0_g2~~TRINITY_DN10149_c0_g2_i1.p1  ORF type:complete len:550 (-),score=125.07 TRINITY_DN10149_c0_g2_i1:705-2354(-)
MMISLRGAVALACVAHLLRGTSSSISSSCSQEEEDLESCEAATVLLQRAANGGRGQQAHKAPAARGSTSRKLSPVGAVRASKGPDGQSAQVAFTYGGQKLSYSLVATSIYTDEAEVVRHTDGGDVHVPPAERVTYQSRDEGKWASAVLLQDGSVMGLFEDSGEIVHVERWSGDASSSEALLELDAADGIPHKIESIPSPLSLAAGMKARVIRKQNATDEEDGPKVEIEVDNDPTNHLGHATPEDVQDLIAEMRGTTPWSGDKWYPGCYSGDSKTHTMQIGVITDVKAHEVFGSDTRSRIEAQVAEASFIYERQMNIKLKIRQLSMYESTKKLPGTFAGNDCGSDFIMNQIKSLRKWNAGRSASQRNVVDHLFTGCGNGWGTVGLAYIDGACFSHGVGVNQLKTSWTTFAHELGHNLGGHHSFEEGKGSTGGIMDYGDGKHDGEYQFNTDYRKDQMCHVLNRMGTCNGKFVEAASASPTPPPGSSPTPLPSPGPTTPPCKDSFWFRDKFWHSCRDWRGHNCYTYNTWWNPYSSTDRKTVRENCPASCGLC